MPSLLPTHFEARFGRVFETFPRDIANFLREIDVARLSRVRLIELNWPTQCRSRIGTGFPHSRRRIAVTGRSSAVTRNNRRMVAESERLSRNGPPRGPSPTLLPEFAASRRV